MKKFEIGMIIAAFDKATGPIKGITGQIRKMTAAEREATRISNWRADSANRWKKGKPPKVEEELEKAEKARDKAMQKAEAEREKLHNDRRARRKDLAVNLGIGAVGAVVAGIGAITAAYKISVAASDEAEAAQLKLTKAMLKNRGETRATVAAVADLAGEIQKKTPVDDESLKNGAAQLAMFGMTGRQIKAMLPALADYLVVTKGVNATSEDSVAAAKLMGKAWAGNTGALRKQGIILSKAQEAIVKHGTASQRTAVIIQAIQSRMGGQAEALGQTPEGIKKRWEQQLNEVEESAGKALMPLRLGALKLANQVLPYLGKIADALPGFLSKATAVLKGRWNQILQWFSSGFKGAKVGDFLKAFRSLGPVVVQLFAKIKPLIDSIDGFIFKTLGQISKWCMEAFTKSQPGLRKIAEAFRPIIDAVKKLWEKVFIPFWEQTLSPLLEWLITEFAPFLVNTLGPMIGDQAEKFSSFVTVLSGLIGKLTQFSSLGQINFFLDFWKKSKAGWDGFKLIFADEWKKFFQPLFDWLTDKWNTFVGLLNKIMPFGSGLSALSSAAGGGDSGAINRPRQLDELSRLFNSGGPANHPMPKASEVTVHITDKTSGGIKAKASSGGQGLRGVYLGVPVFG